jgi:hypothetical protein
MATSFKSLNAETDIQRISTKLHEAIPLTGTIVSGTYGALGSEENIKNYSHGMFQSVYDYPYLSSSANHIFDITLGVGRHSALYASVTDQQNQKHDIYNELAQVLAGYGVTGSINRLEQSGNFGSSVDANQMNDVFCVNFARLLTKDEIQKEQNGFTITVGVSSSWEDPFGQTMNIIDISGSQGYRNNSPVGDFNILYATASGYSNGPDNVACGLVFYQAGVAILTSSIFQNSFVTSSAFSLYPEPAMELSGRNVTDLLTGSAISASCDGFRHRLQNISFNNTTDLNSTIYFCRANNSEFNYSSNPTYLTASQLRVKDVPTDNPVSYVTTVGLYSEDNALLGVGKLSEPLKKTPADEYTLRVRLDY